MDNIIHVALDEICAQGLSGLHLTQLWPRLLPSLTSSNLTLCPSLKRAVWSGLVKIPGLTFQPHDEDFDDPKSKPFEVCERMELRIVASEQLRRNFVGLYDVKSSLITPPQQRVLELLALAREKGITQNQLCKELGMPANNFFYVVKRLESWGLVVRQSIIVRTKDASSDKEPKNVSPVHTNLIRLRRYALPLSSQQRLEITKENKNTEESLGESVPEVDSVCEEGGQDDVLVKDFLPALKAVCDRLEQAEGQVLVVSDIKRELGYREARGHRAWRNICNRLKQAGLVEVFEAKVDKLVSTTTDSKKSRSRGQNKPVSCLRLLKKFSPNLFGQKTADREDDNLFPEQTLSSSNQAQNTEQLVELPLEQQIVDMIDAEGSRGLLGVEVCRRLGISSKMLDNLSNIVVPRFGLHQLSENRKRGSAYRFWTRGNFSPMVSCSKSENGGDECGLAPPTEGLSGCETAQRTSPHWHSLSPERCTTGESSRRRGAEQELSDSQVNEGSQMVVWPEDSHDLSNDMNLSVPVLVTANKSSSRIAESSSQPLPKALHLQEGQRYPSLTSTQREQRILEKLKTEKIILKPQVQRWLESFEKDKQTRMDRKTLKRCLIKLEREGHCRLVNFSIPGVTNCGNLREILVVLHPSVEGSARELSDQVHDKVRAFENEIRCAASPSKKNLPVPVLLNIKRLQNPSNSDVPSGKSEAMRANGFVLAKMVRTKILHHFLWGYVNKSAGSDEAPLWSKQVYSSRDLRSSGLLFRLDAAIKAMPLELFLQVVGTATKLADMVEKCKAGLLLSDLSDDEYKSLMDTRAIGRLSWLVDLLRRLKLIRLVADESPEDVAKISHATLTYSLELKSYIEEPPAVDPLLRGSSLLDLRPQFRHDFVLSSVEALDKYWQTLEYCFAAADSNASLHAFPGSVVHEVCLYRSWTTVRVMTTEQRAKLIKCIKDQGSKKLNFKECREIAKDLNLTLEQVLRVYYDNRQGRLNKCKESLDDQGADADVRHTPSRRRRKARSEGGPNKRVKFHHSTGSQGDMEEARESEAEDGHELSGGECVLPMLKRPRQTKFSWSEVADRQVIIQYARQRAIQGARRGTDWASISDLPAPPDTCRRRVAVLRTDVKFRKSLMRLCNLLTHRYAQSLDYEKNKVDGTCSSTGPDCQRESWDDFDDSKVKVALHEVLMHKQLMKVEASKRPGAASEGVRNPMPTAPCQYESECGRKQIDSSRRSRLHRLPQKFVKQLKEGVVVTRQVHESLPVSNAVELFKLVFLTTSKATEMPNLLAETLRCYSEHDLFSAFDYLRQKNIMVGSGSSQPFVLSLPFLKSLSLSQFPENTGKRAAKLASWVHEKEEGLIEGIVNLPPDLQCGDIFHLFALVSSGELSIAPLLPDEGVGEPEDSRSSKRKANDHDSDECSVSKKLKYHSLQESEIFSRKEKGFPGLAVSLSRSTYTRSHIVQFFGNVDKTLLFSDNDHFYATLGQKINTTSSTFNHAEEHPDFDSITPSTVIHGETQWEVMANYIVEHLLKSSEHQHIQTLPELIKTAYTSIQKAGDQGLSLSRISEYMGMLDANLAESVVDVLKLFGLVLKVNGYNFVHVVDALYRTKYSLTSKGSRQVPDRAPSSIVLRMDADKNDVGEVESCEQENSMTMDDVHKVTILNLSEDISHYSGSVQAQKDLQGSSQNESMSFGGMTENQKFEVSASSFQLIVPWINGDGTINEIVYRGLRRRILGIVTQNPGILEDDVIGQMEVLNPQSCRKLLELMVLDKHLRVRKMSQSITSSKPPSLLASLVGIQMKKSDVIFREHYFANPMSTSLL